MMLCLVLTGAISAEAQYGNGRGARNRDRVPSASCPRFIASGSLQPLTVEETAKILFIREEEKLALDVYRALYEKWRVRIFNNIAASEQRHFEAMGTIIARYELSDPAKPAPGEFTDPVIQQMYDDLIATGSKSLADALQVGVAIEEKDIEDLKAALSITDNKDVLMVYGNLLNGSLNHLDAFNSHLDTLSSE